MRCWYAGNRRPLPLDADNYSLSVTSRNPERHEQLRDLLAPTQFGRALAELDIEWTAAHSPQAKGGIERLFSTLHDWLEKGIHLEGIDTVEAANRFVEITFWPFRQKRLVVPPARAGDAHRRLNRGHRLGEILSVRMAWTVAADHAMICDGQRWGVPCEEDALECDALARKSNGILIVAIGIVFATSI